MRDKRFIAEHRGGLLKKAEHRQLVQWAGNCARHVLPLLGENVDARLQGALAVADRWAVGHAATSEAMRASRAAHAAAREAAHPVAAAVARAVGQAVATAHMADHSLRAAWYALKATRRAGKPVAAEQQWQQEQLPPALREWIAEARQTKEPATPGDDTPPRNGSG
ncbi:MAG: hypothetical protein ICV83_09190 [Cytophagales bacterium]|nr:hypothetical protein [Cytophagales bacterium]